MEALSSQVTSVDCYFLQERSKGAYDVPCVESELPTASTQNKY